MSEYPKIEPGLMRHVIKGQTYRVVRGWIVRYSQNRESSTMSLREARNELKRARTITVEFRT